MSVQYLTLVPTVLKNGSLGGMIGNMPCMFDREVVQPEVGKPIKVVFTKAVYRKDSAGNASDKLRFWLVRPFVESDIIVPHTGFKNGKCDVVLNVQDSTKNVVLSLNSNINTKPGFVVCNKDEFARRQPGMYLGVYGVTHPMYLEKL